VPIDFVTPNVNTWKKIFAGFLLLLGVYAAVSGCVLKPPAAGTLQASTQTATVALLDACTGPCPIYLTLDNGNPVTLIAKEIHYFPNVTLGSHSLNFNANAAIYCSSGPGTCLFYGYTQQMGYGLGVNNAGSTQTISVTDNGCGYLMINFY
jgi:hypothetical protein